MIHQYRAQRHTYIETARGRLPVGTVPVGTVCYPCGRNEARTAPVIVEAWKPRQYAAWDGSRMHTKSITGGHLAVVRCLASNRRFEISDCYLIDAETKH